MCSSDPLHVLPHLFTVTSTHVLAIPFVTTCLTLNPITILGALFHSLEYTKRRNTDMEVTSNKRNALNYNGYILKCQIHKLYVSNGALLD